MSFQNLNPLGPLPPKPPKKPNGPKPYDPLQRQLDEAKRREHDRQLDRYRQGNPNAPRG